MNAEAKERSLEVQNLLKQKIEKQGIQVDSVFAIGSKVDTQFYIAVETDEKRDELKADQELIQQLFLIFKDSGYSEFVSQAVDEEAARKNIKKYSISAYETAKKIGFTIESQETVDRKFDGDWLNVTR